MKKVLFLITALAMILLIAGCTNPADSSDNSNKESDKDTAVYNDFKPVEYEEKTFSVTVQDGNLSSPAYSHSFTYSPEYFTADNTVYNPEISDFLVMLASDIYGLVKVNFDDDNEADSEINEDLLIYEKLGMKDAVLYDLQKTDYENDVNDITAAAFAHQEYVIDGNNYSIIFATIRGTDGTYEQWSSNFDMGADSEAYYSKTGNAEEHPDWSNKKHHKGFDVAANRINAKLSKYLEDNVVFKNTQKVLVFTGHSRGAAIANILGSIYEADKNYKTFTYTYATPNVTTEKPEAAAAFKTVFNIINSDDLIPVMPLEDWGFIKYGTTIKESINDSYSNKWNTVSGLTYVSAEGENACEENGMFFGVCNSRDDFYTIIRDEKNLFTSKKAKETVIKDFEKYGLTSFITELEKTDSGVSCYVCPAYTFQLVCNAIPLLNSSSLNLMSLFNIMNYGAEGYNSVINGFKTKGTNKSLVYSHTPTSYIVLSNNINENYNSAE